MFEYVNRDDAMGVIKGEKDVMIQAKCVYIPMV